VGTGLDPTTVRDFLIALLIGALLGLEREKRKASEGDVGIAGIRTFILIAQAGAVSAWLSRDQQPPWVFVAVLLAVAALTVTGYRAQTRIDPSSLGLTTEVAAIATCLLGGMVLFGHPEIAVALAIVTSAVLAYKQPLHALVERIGSDDLFAAVKLLIATFVVLPLLPNRPVDPLGALNPYELWWLVILISTLSLVGYVAVRWFGTTTGTLLMGLFGGLASSTAVTRAFARQSRDGATARGGAADALTAGVLVAWAVMFARVVIEVLVVHPPLLPRVLATCGVMGLAALVAAGVLYRRGRSGPRPDAAPSPAVPLRNPFSLSSAIRFALLFAVVLLFVELAERYVSAGGLYLVAGIAGLTDVDAITLSMAELARGGGDAGTASAAILVAAITNTIVKTGFVVALGAATLRGRILAAAAFVLAAGGATLFFR
jgi:uncharacterized membrane protein (DUF4010 family)